MQVQFDTRRQTAYEHSNRSSGEQSRDGMDGAIQFGRFCAIPHSRQLLMDGRPQEIGGRAFDLLMVLLKSNGGIVSKDEILNKVWPSMIVEECNLRFQVKSLRRALGPDGDKIKTVVRRGYMLIREDSGDRSPGIEIAPLPTLLKAAPTPVATPHTPLVALIEDDESVRRAISSLLRSVGLRVGSYESVQSFQDRGKDESPDCLILDVCLPGRNGLDFQADLLKTGLFCPIIFISGHADIQMSVRAMKAGAVEFLTKPVRHQDLLTAVDSAVGR
ncbi:response regulator [Pararhizobium sp. DWP3-4]|uniref:response regulator n=1 Tax=unclassified Pararhizobium TaxID=2643050 RepID=UPI003CEF9ECE